ncbi:hypothetical protein PVAP13_9KG468000 [Panicum virgatum]|uniref:DUF3511 domain protein n=2 Tax=Panicum virgatum TaxID=38727 RepID=A0A8T0NX00_PANVG|nr:hypothetical protein PVAP13_9KG468000 [Panicum virgatum]
MAAADYDRAYRPDAAPAPAPAAAGEFDRPYRNEVVPYGDRRLDIVVKPPARSPPPPLPASARSGGGAGSAWCFSDPEMKRRRRVASYKAYSVEGKVKASLRRGFRWIKAKCSKLIQGWYGSRPILPSPFPRFSGSSRPLFSSVFSDMKRHCVGWVRITGPALPLGNGFCSSSSVLAESFNPPFFSLSVWTVGTIDCHCPCASSYILVS